MGFATKEQATKIIGDNKVIKFLLWFIALSIFALWAGIITFVCADEKQTAKDTGYLFPLKEPVYTHGKILCTSWYSKLRTEIINGKRTTYQYKALNYPSKYGTDILASGDGVVIDTLIDGYEGGTITIQYDNGLTMRVCHLSKQLVLDGMRVKRGQVIGKVGRSGRTTGSHLRIVIEKNGERVFCNAETWGMKYTDFNYSKTEFDAGQTIMYAQNK